MKKMAGFRNIAIHQYEKIEIAIVEGIINNHLNHFNQFVEAVLKIEQP